MINNLLLKELKERRWMLIIGFLFFIATGIIVIISHNIMSSLIIDELPVILGEASGFLANMLQESVAMFQNHTRYFWSQWHAKNLLQAGTVFSIIIGMGLISRETSHGTIGYLVSKPISKKQIYIIKAVTGIIILYSVIILSTIISVIFALIQGLEIDVSKIFIGLVPILIGLLPVYLTAAYFSNKFDDSVKAGLFTAVLWGALSIFGIFSRTQNLSPFTHMRAAHYFAGGSFPILSILTLGVLGLTIFYIGLRSFENREF